MADETVRVESWDGPEDCIVTLGGKPVGQSGMHRREAEHVAAWFRTALSDLFGRQSNMATATIGVTGPVPVLFKAAMDLLIQSEWACHVDGTEYCWCCNGALLGSGHRSDCTLDVFFQRVKESGKTAR